MLYEGTPRHTNKTVSSCALVRLRGFSIGALHGDQRLDHTRGGWSLHRETGCS